MLDHRRHGDERCGDHGGFFAVFVTMKFAMIQQVGLGLAVAVLVGPTVVRTILLPAFRSEDRLDGGSRPRDPRPGAMRGRGVR